VIRLPPSPTAQTPPKSSGKVLLCGGYDGLLLCDLEGLLGQGFAGQLLLDVEGKIRRIEESLKLLRSFSPSARTAVWTSDQPLAAV
jgi:hypothetical protein